MSMLRKLALCGVGAAALLSATVASANPDVGGVPMFENRTIVQNAMNSKDHTTLVAAVKAAGLVETLNGTGPFTVFAPVNAAFDKLPGGTVETLLKPENKGALTAVLTYHVVPGKLSLEDLWKDVRANGGRAWLTTVQGEKLEVVETGNNLEIIDAKGDRSMITIGNVFQSNGVIHVVDTVLLPN